MCPGDSAGGLEWRLRSMMRLQQRIDRSMDSERVSVNEAKGIHNGDAQR